MQRGNNHSFFPTDPDSKDTVQGAIDGVAEIRARSRFVYYAVGFMDRDVIVVDVC